MRPTHGKPIDAEKAERILSALRQGKTLNVICSGRVNGKRGASQILATYIRFREYCAEHPDFAREANALLAENTKAGNARKGERHRNMTHCKHGHSLADAWVTYQNGYSKRDCRTCWLLRSRRGGVMKPETFRKVEQALINGAPIGQITHGHPTGGGPKDLSLKLVDAMTSRIRFSTRWSGRRSRSRELEAVSSRWSIGVPGSSEPKTIRLQS